MIVYEDSVQSVLPQSIDEPQLTSRKYSMTCEHLQQLFHLCQTSQLKLSSSDLIHIVCKQCDREEVCPSVLVEQFELRRADRDASPTEEAKMPGEAPAGREAQQRELPA